MTTAETKFAKQCNQASKKLLGLECIPEGDPNDLLEPMLDAMAAGQKPEEFVRDVYVRELSEIEPERPGKAA